MKVTVENGENQQVTLTIEVEAAEVNKAVDQACKRLANRVSIPGFRKGKAPRMIVERHVGKDAVLQEAFDIVAPKALSKAFDEQKIDPVTRPSVDIETLEEGKDLVFKATVTPRPEVKLGDYKGLNVPKNEVSITDEDVEKQLKTFQDRQGKLVDAPEGAEVKDGDKVVVTAKFGKSSTLSVAASQLIVTFLSSTTASRLAPRTGSVTSEISLSILCDVSLPAGSVTVAVNVTFPNLAAAGTSSTEKFPSASTSTLKTSSPTVQETL